MKSPRLWAIVVLAAVLRLPFLGWQPLWRDEAFTALTAHRPLNETIDVVSRDSAPPLSYVIDHFLLQAWDSPWTLRLTSALAGIAMVLVAAALGQRLAGDSGALWSAALVAVLPSSVIASRDGRMYALGAVLTLASTLCALRCLERPTWRRWSLYAVTVVLAVYTVYFAAFVVAAQVVATLVVFRVPARVRLMVLGGGMVGAVALIPWLLVARAQFAHADTPFWVSPLGLESLLGTTLQFFSGPPIDSGVSGRVVLLILQAVVVSGGVIAALVAVVRHTNRTEDQRHAVHYLLVCGIVPIGLLFAISIWRPLVEARYASVMWGSLLCCLGAALAQLPWRRLAMSVVIACGVVSVVLGLARTNPDTPAALQALSPPVAGNDLIETTPATYLLVRYYGDDTVAAHAHIVDHDVPWYWGTATYPADAVVSDIPANVLAHRGRIWYVNEPGQQLPDPPLSYHLVGATSCYSTICVTGYVPQDG